MTTTTSKNKRSISIEQKNAVLQTMAKLLESGRNTILEANKLDVEDYSGGDQAMLDRLKVNDKKVDGMIQSVHEVKAGNDPVGHLLYDFTRPDGLRVTNRSVPFGTILIIYESRPDVTIEAAALAFKAGNKILLKGGKEARHSNKILTEIWHQSLEINGLSKEWIVFLDFNREETQSFLRVPDRPVDLIVPRGGEKLIEYVKTHSNVPVIVSGRGNNFLYVDPMADWEKSLAIIVASKIQKISACNSLDKVLFDSDLPDLSTKIQATIDELTSAGVEILGDAHIAEQFGVQSIPNEDIWAEEFLSMKIVLGISPNMELAINKINQYCGGHSVVIMTEDVERAEYFMEAIDTTAIYHNASTRFTDGGQFGLGAELGISTEKLHHRGPLGLGALVTNKWFIYGNGQIRK